MNGPALRDDDDGHPNAADKPFWDRLHHQEVDDPTEPEPEPEPEPDPESKRRRR